MEIRLIRSKDNENKNKLAGAGAIHSSQPILPGQSFSPGIDLNDALIRNKKDTFFFRMNGNTMEYAGIYDHDILIVDRALNNVNGKVVIACYNGEMIVRRLERSINKICLLSENKNSHKIEVQEDADFIVWGVVTHSIHSL